MKHTGYIPKLPAAANLNCRLFSKTLIQPNKTILLPFHLREVRCPVFRVSKHFVSSVSPALYLAFVGWECWMADFSCVVFWWMGWMGGVAFTGWLVFFSGKKWCFLKILMQQDQLISRKADLLIEWGAFFYLLFDWELVESISRFLTNNLGWWSTIIGWYLCQIRDGLGDYSNVIWDSVLPSDLFSRMVEYLKAKIWCIDII